MNIDQIINQFYGFRCESARIEGGASSSGDSTRSVSDSPVVDASARTAMMLSMGDRFAVRLANKIATFGSGASLSKMAFKAYDNWKHQHNEVTEIAAEVDFRRFGLRESAVDAHDFELIMMRVMVKAANLDGDFTIDIQGAGAVGVRPALTGEDSHSVVKGFVSHDSLLDEIARKNLSIELRMELYLAAFLVAGVHDLSPPPFLKQLTKELQLPEEIINQIQFQLPLSFQQAA